MSSPDRKRTSTSPSSTAAVVSPEKSNKKLKTEEGHEEGDEEGVSAASIMRFPKYPDTCNGDIMTNHYDFVIWAKRKKEEGTVGWKLKDFLEWVESPEGRRLEIEGQRRVENRNGNGNDGNEKFSFGKHKGKTFEEVALEDPKYHVRFLGALRRKGEKPSSVLSRYISWFESGGGSSRRVQSSHTAISRSRQVISNRSPSGSGGDERFTFGKHRGRTFCQVAEEDPSYHLRCDAMGYCPKPYEMERYTRYFDQFGDDGAAARGEREAIECAIGILPPECFGQYD